MEYDEEQEPAEKPEVEPPNTIVYEKTVVIETFDALLAFRAMVASDRSDFAAGFAMIILSVLHHFTLR